jgi:phosphatidylcholine synthase
VSVPKERPIDAVARRVGDPEERAKAAAFSVHLLTASGAGLAVLAALAAASGNWFWFWIWLGIALIVDGIDGPIARKLHVQKRLPNWSGDTLDQVIDYVTYVFLPALAVPWAGVVTGLWGAAAAGIIVVSSALYYADTRMKMPDNSFRGFPIVWNMVVFVLVALQVPEAIAFGIIAALGVLTFLPVAFVHPVRVKRFRPITLSVMLAWAITAGFVIANDMRAVDWTWWALVGTTVYLFTIGAYLQATNPKEIDVDDED